MELISTRSSESSSGQFSLGKPQSQLALEAPSRFSAFGGGRLTSVLPALDVGAGDKQLGDINVDLRPLPGIGVVCHALSLPFREGVFRHVYLSHVVEHLRYHDVKRLLSGVYAVLAAEGQVEIWMPNFQALSLFKAWLLGGVHEGSTPMLYPPLSGDQDYEANTHLSHWSLKLLERYVTSRGFKILLAKTEGNYSGSLIPLRIFMHLFPTRGGVIHLIALKDAKPNSGELLERSVASLC